jgi:thioredoxin reductase (NADPH)
MVKHIYSKGTPHKEIQHYDVLILGAGPAGLTAAIYAARYGLKTAVIARSFGGMANLAVEVENWPGYKGTGFELLRKFKEQAAGFGARFLEAEVHNTKKDSNGFVLETGDKEIHGKTLIIALGTQHQKLGIQGESEFIGKGISYCVTCDSNFFKNKQVAVIGGGDSAVQAALTLAEVASRVFLIYRGEHLKCQDIFCERIKKKKNIETVYNAVPEKILGDRQVSALEIEQKGKKRILILDGIFIEIGAVPTNEIVEDLRVKMDKENYIITDKSARTSIPGLFAAGDVTDNPLKQMVTAAAEGAIAARSAHEFLMKNK